MVVIKQDYHHFFGLKSRMKTTLTKSKIYKNLLILILALVFYIMRLTNLKF